MPLSRREPRPGSRSGAAAPSPTRRLTNPSALEDDDEISVWQPAAPRLRLYSPATPRPASAAPTSPRRTASGFAPHPRPTSPIARPSSAICGSLSLPSAHERGPAVATTATSPGAAPPTPTHTRAAAILSKVQAIQARASAAAQTPRAIFGAPTAAAAVAAAATSQSLLYDSPPGSPLLVVRSVPRPPRRLPTSTSTSPGSPPLVAANRSRRSSLPDPFLHPSSSGSGLPPPTPGAPPQSGEADTAAAAAAQLSVGVAASSSEGVSQSQSQSGSPHAASPRSGDSAHRPVGSLLSGPSSEGALGVGGDGGSGMADRRTASGVGDSNGAASDGSAGDSGTADNGAAAAADSGGGAESGEEDRAFNRRPSAMAAGGSGRFSAAAAPPSTTSPSPSPVIWPWPHDSSRRSSVAEGSPFCASPSNLSFLNHLNLSNNPNNPTHSNHPYHLSLRIDGRGSTLAGGPLPLRGGPVLSSPVRPASSAALLATTRSVSLRSRPRSCSGGGAAATARPILSISSGRTFAGSSGGGGGGAVAAAAATAPASTMYEIIPDLHSLPAAAAATTVPPGGRVARAIAGILPSGNPGTFNLRVEERIHQVLSEGVSKAPTPRAAAAPPNPVVIKMLHDRHEAAAQRSLVDSAFSSGNPSAWMHQIMAESGAAAPPWAAAQHAAQQRQAAAQQQAAALAAHAGRLTRVQSGKQSPVRQMGRQQTVKSPRSHHHQSQQHSQQLIARSGNGALQAALGGGGALFAVSSPQRLSSSAVPAAAAAAAAAAGGGCGGCGLGPGVPRHTSAETLHLQSMSYLASKEACRTLAADSRPAVSINLREVLLEGSGTTAGGGGGGGLSPMRPRSGGLKVRFQ